MPLVAAKCTQCGANIQVENDKEASICPYCNTPYIVEKAINNYNVSVHGSVIIENAVVMGSNADNLAKRGEEFEKSGDIKKAIEYYNKALDIDVDCVRARAGIDRIKNNERNALISQLLEDAKKNETTNIDVALQIYNKVISMDNNNDIAKKRLASLKNMLNNYEFFSSKAKTLKDAGVIRLSVSTLTFFSKKGENQLFPLDKIQSLVAKENLHFSGESFGRTKPNSIRFTIKTTNVEEKANDYKVHNAKELSLIIRALKDKKYQQALNLSKEIQQKK